MIKDDRKMILIMIIMMMERKNLVIGEAEEKRKYIADGEEGIYFFDKERV
jgi:hypothetical protein